MRSLRGSTLLASIVLCAVHPSRPPIALAGAPPSPSLSPSPSSSSPSSHLPSPLPLDVLLAAVRARAPSLIERRRSAEAAALRPLTRGRPADPELSLEWYQQPIDFRSVPLMATVRQKLPWPRTLELEQEAGSREARIARDDVAIADRRIEAEARRAFFDLALAEAALVLNQRMESLMGHLVEVARAQYRVGRVAQVDVLRAQSELLVVTGDRFDLERDRVEAVARLNGLLDRPASTPLGPAAEGLATSPLPSRELLAAAVAEHRPDLQRAQDRIAAAQARRALAEREGRPEVQVWAGYMIDVRGTDSFTLGLSSTLPVFSRGLKRALVQVESAEIEAARASLAADVRQADVEVETALARLEGAARHVKLHSEQLVPLADSALESAQASYVAGRVGLVTVLDAARAVREHHLDHQRFLAEYRKRLADLEEAVGVPLGMVGSGKGGGL